MKLQDRAKQNDLNCIAGTMQILYSLSQYGIIAEPYASWINGCEPPPKGKQLDDYNKAIIDISSCIIGFYENIKEDGKIIGEL